MTIMTSSMLVPVIASLSSEIIKKRFSNDFETQASPLADDFGLWQAEGEGLEPFEAHGGGSF